MSTTLYGIKNCDTVRAARRWLDTHNIDYVFSDVREQALSPQQLQSWLQELGLALVKHIVNAHGGHVSVTSNPGEGSRFSLFFPLVPENGESPRDSVGN